MISGPHIPAVSTTRGILIHTREEEGGGGRYISCEGAHTVSPVSTP